MSKNLGRYRICSRGYLSRALSCLEEPSPNFLFYAAFELRCGIEARLKEYLEAQEEIEARKKRGWEIPKLAKNLERVFTTGNKIVFLGIRDPATSQSLVDLYYTPVTESLQKRGGRLGDWLHSQKHFRNFDDPWWVESRKYLCRTAEELRIATTGTLLAPPLMKRDTKKMIVKTEFTESDDANVMLQKVGGLGTESVLEIRYLDTLPPNLMSMTTLAVNKRSIE